MTSINRSAQRVCLVLLLSLFAEVSLANAVGKLVFAVRGVVVQHQGGNETAGVKGTELVEGDTVVTSANGRAQLLMSDGARIALKPDSQFQIESYKPAATQPAAGVVVSASGGDTGVLNLLKGGMRAVSGSMTKVNPGGLVVKTPVATMGIRGTGWKCVLVGGAKQKLLLKVVDGQVVIKTPFGDLAVNPGEIASVIAGEAARLELEESDDFIDDTDAVNGEDEDDDSDDDSGDKTVMDGEGDSESSDGAGSSKSADGEPTDEELEEEFVEEILGVFIEDDEVAELLDYFTEEELVEIIVEVISEFTVPVGAVGIREGNDIVTVQGESSVVDLLIADDESLGEFIATYSDSDSQHPSVEAVFSIVDSEGAQTAEVFNLGIDDDTGFVWGRWANGSASSSPAPEEEVAEGEEPPVNDFEGEDISLPGQESVHWFYGPPGIGEPLADITASASYSLVGNTEPTDSSGNLGVLGVADLTANFSTGAVDLNLQLGINNQNWSASGSGQMQESTHLSFSGNNLSGNITDGQTNIGTVSGQFVGGFSNILATSNGIEVPAGAAVSYGLLGNITAGGSNAVSGVAVMGNPDASTGGRN